MRKYLVTTFFCSECGGELGVEYEAYVKPKTSKRAKDPGITGRQEPTGADMATNVVYVKPCYNCLAPARNAQIFADNMKAVMEGALK